MILTKHELKQGKLSLLIWTLSIGFLMAVCIFLFPEMKSQMEDVNKIFASMGSFTAAFGMDRLNFGTLTGFYSIECGNILGLGGAFFATLTAGSILAKEEKDKTAEFLLTHPVSRFRVVTEKLFAVLIQLIIMNSFILILSLGSIAATGEEIPFKEILLLHLAYFLLQTELSSVAFGISAFLRRGSAGAALGLAAAMYFLNLIANITEAAEFLRYLTPFAYCEGADIIEKGALNPAYLLPGILYAILGIGAAYIKYCKKDIS